MVSRKTIIFKLKISICFSSFSIFLKLTQNLGFDTKIDAIKNQKKEIIKKSQPKHLLMFRSI